MKKVIITLLLIAPLISFSQSITDSLLLYYKMDANALDETPNNFHATSSGVVAVPDRFGNPNSAFNFPGISVNSTFEFPKDSLLKPEFPITVSFWTMIPDVSSGIKVFFNTDYVQNNYHGIWMAVDAAGFVRIGFGGGDASLGCVSSNRISYTAYEFPITDSTWHHIVGVVRSATDMDIFIDCNNAGAQFSTGTGPTSMAYSGYGSCCGGGIIGETDGNNNAPPFFFEGNMDDFAYWNRDLTSTEINSLCNSSPIVFPPISSWNCVNGDCIDPLDGTGTYTDSTACVTSCVSTGIDEINSNKKLIKITDILGRNVKRKKNEFLFYIYEDGTVEKKIIIN
ncbi:MAG: LamG domain-containing protein [Flavobacteriales bacterium]|nr:LamG domain-containing protein [Flavobacteriales bacterium]